MKDKEKLQFFCYFYAEYNGRLFWFGFMAFKYFISCNMQEKKPNKLWSELFNAKFGLYI